MKCNWIQGLHNRHLSPSVLRLHSFSLPGVPTCNGLTVTRRAPALGTTTGSDLVATRGVLGQCFPYWVFTGSGLAATREARNPRDPTGSDLIATRGTLAPRNPTGSDLIATSGALAAKT